MGQLPPKIVNVSFSPLPTIIRVVVRIEAKFNFGDDDHHAFYKSRAPPEWCRAGLSEGDNDRQSGFEG